MPEMAIIAQMTRPMRHVVGVMLALVLAAALFAGGGWGVQMISSLQRDGTGLISMTGVLAVVAVVATGALLGVLLVTPGVSPLAAGLPGLALLAWTALLLVSSARAQALIPLHGHDVEAGFRTLLTSGVLALLGMAMIVPLFVPSRWRRRADADGDFGDFGPPASSRLLQLSPAVAQ